MAKKRSKKNGKRTARYKKSKKSRTKKLKGGNMFAAAGAELLTSHGGKVIDGVLTSSGLTNPNTAFNNQPDKKIETIDSSPMELLYGLVRMSDRNRFYNRRRYR